jgi:hypothetical protein
MAVKSFKKLATGGDVIKLFTATILEFAYQAILFVSYKPFQDSMMFKGKAGAYSIKHLSGAPL